MVGLIGMLAEGPEKQAEIVFLDGIMREIRFYEPVAHGVSGRVAYRKQDDHYLCIKATVGGQKTERQNSDSLAPHLKEILDARTPDKVTAILERYHRKDQYKIVEN